MPEPLYEPSPWGVKYHNLTTHHALGAGAAGPGKSVILLWDPLPQIIVEHNRCADPKHEFPLLWEDSVGWALHLRRTKPMLDTTIGRAKRAFYKIDPNVKWENDRGIFTFSSGFKYQFGHCMNPGDWEIYMSNEYTHISFDELVQFEEEQYDQISGRCRTTDPVLKYMLKVRAMSNPMMHQEGNRSISVKNPRWVYERFVQPAPDGEVILRKKIRKRSGEVKYRTRIYLPAKLYDNPNQDFVDQFEETLLEKPPHIRHALLYGSWDVTVGSFYGDDWNPQLHVIRPFKIPDDWPRFRSLDWGYKTSGCVLWWAMDFDDNLFCEKEYSFKGKTDIEVAKRIKDIEQDLDVWGKGRSLLTGPADTQLWEERGDTGKSKAATMSEHGVDWVAADKKSTVTNARRFLSRLKDHNHGTTDPGVMFMENCKMCKQTIPRIQIDANDPEKPASGGDDHWHDAALYASAYASHGRGGIQMLREEREYEEDAPTDRGQYGYGSSVC